MQYVLSWSRGFFQECLEWSGLICWNRCLAISAVTFQQQCCCLNWVCLFCSHRYFCSLSVSLAIHVRSNALSKPGQEPHVKNVSPQRGCQGEYILNINGNIFDIFRSLEIVLGGNLQDFLANRWGASWKVLTVEKLSLSPRFKGNSPEERGLSPRRLGGFQTGGDFYHLLQKYRRHTCPFKEI